MARAPNQSVPGQGFFRRALAGILAFEQAMDSTSVDYELGRIERLEREVERLNEELRQGHAPAAVDVRE